MSWRDYAEYLTESQIEQFSSAEHHGVLTADELLTAAKELALSNDFEQACGIAYGGSVPDGAECAHWEPPAISGRGETAREVCLATEYMVDADGTRIRAEVAYIERLDGTLINEPRVRVGTGDGDPIDATPAQARELAQQLLALAHVAEAARRR